MLPLLVICIAYLLGSIPFGYLIVQATQGADVRETGSGGTGATNVSRRAGKAAGIFTLVLDAAKGAAAVAVAQLFFGGPVTGIATQWWIAAAAIAAIVGHIFPVWLRFDGGKGVATGVGVFLMVAPITVVLAALVFTVAVVLTRHVSLGSILAALAIPIFVLGQNAFILTIEPLAPVLTVALAGASLIVFAHRENIRRLLAGNESKFK